MNLEIWDALCDQVDSAGSQAGGRRALRKWIERNIAHPTIDSKPWSWEGHEYQLGIVEDLHPQIHVQKCAQVGVSELAVAITLGLLGVFPNSNIIYALQSKTYAQTFATSRISPAINKSSKLRALLNREVDSTSLKQIGSSFLHLTGTASESGAISVPASALIVDEASFAKPSVLGALASRLEHKREEEKIILGFSTPLYSGMGISLSFDQGTQHTFMVRHDACGKWVSVEPLTDYIVPGHDGPIDKLERRDLESGKACADDAFVRCSGCGEVITQANLAAAEKRAWVPKYLERVGKIGGNHSYQVHPTDVSSIKSMPQIIRSLHLYKSTDKFIQYGIGLPFDGGGGKINEEVSRKAFIGENVSIDQGKLHYGTVIGVDVGKTSHVCIAKRVDGKMIVLRMETVRQGFEGETQQLIRDRILQFNCRKGVSDAQPDHTLVRAVQEMTPYDLYWGAYFVRSMSGSLNPWKVKEAEGMVAVARTRVFDAFVDYFNAGNVILPNVPFKEEIVSHLQAIRRITDERATGEDASTWQKITGIDHWFLSLLYTYVALEMLDEEGGVGLVPASMLGMGRVPLRG